MRTKLLICCLVSPVCLALPVAAQAHTLKTDGTVSAILHLGPEDDNPAAGEPTDFLFDLSGPAGHIDPSQCDCRVSVSEHGTALYAGSLHGFPQVEDDDTIFNSGFTVTLPRQDAYSVTLSGTPLVAGDFPTFNLTWDVPVSRGAEAADPDPFYAWLSTPRNVLGAAAGAIVLVLGAVLLLRAKR